MTKPNCYECKWRGKIPGDCHSKCNHPKVAMTPDNPLNGLLALLGSVGRCSSLPVKLANPLNVEGDPHGIKKGWFCWPINFDPVWLQSCDGFEVIKQEGGESKLCVNKEMVP